MKKLDFYLQQILIGSLYVFALAMPFFIALTQISLGVAILCWLLRVFVTKTIKFEKISLEWPYMVFIGAVLLSLVFSTNMPQSFIFLKRLLLIPIVYLLALNVRDKKVFNWLIYLFIISITIYSLTGILSYLKDPSERVRHIQNSMTAGGITMVGSLLAFTMMLVLKKWHWRIISFAAFALNFVCLILTSTRGSWVGFMFGAALILFFLNKKLIIGLLLLLPVIYLVTPPAFSVRLTHIFDPTWGSNAKRIEWWAVGYKIFKDHPLVGVGDISTNNVYKQYAPPGTTELVGHFHSNYVHIAVTLGSIGLLAYLFMMTGIFITLLKTRKNAGYDEMLRTGILTALGVFIAFNMNGFFEWNYGDQEIITMIWFVTGLALALPHLGKYKTE